MATVGKRRQRLAAWCYLPEETETVSASQKCSSSRFGRPHRPVSGPVVAVLCTQFSVKDAKNDIPRREAGTKSSSYVSCLPLPFCRLCLSHLTRAISVYGELAGRSHVHRSGGVRIYAKAKCVMAKIIYCMASPLRVSLLWEFKDNSSMLSRGRATLLPASAVGAKSIYVKSWCKAATFRKHKMAQHRASCLVAILCSEKEWVCRQWEGGRTGASAGRPGVGPYHRKTACSASRTIYVAQGILETHAVVQCQEESIRPKAGSCFCHLLAMDLRRVSWHLWAFIFLPIK